MKVRVLSLCSLALAIACLAGASACATMPAASSATTQSLGEASVVAGVAASTIAATVPAPWGQIIAAALGVLSVIGGIIAHSAVAKNSAQQIAGAVTTGVQAASQSLASAVGSPAVVAK
jgi:hypothetical protein